MNFPSMSRLKDRPAYRNDELRHFQKVKEKREENKRVRVKRDTYTDKHMFKYFDITLTNDLFYLVI